jgi:hypothetical protein
VEPIDEIARLIVDSRPERTVEYRLFDSTGAVAAKGTIEPFQRPSADLPSGRYRLTYHDGAGGEVWACEFEYNSTAQPLRAKAEEAFAALDFDREARLELDRRKTSEFYHKTLDLRMEWLKILTEQGKAEMRIKARQDEVYEKLIENNRRMVEAIGERIAKFQTPPEPPALDRVIANAFPAVSAMYIETVRAIKGDLTPRPRRELQPPNDDRMKQARELLRSVSSVEQLSALMEDKEKFQAWMDAIQRLMKDDPRNNN